MSLVPLGGVLPVLQMPFASDGTIDMPVLARELDWVFQVGADGACLAMVSEWLRLMHDERLQLIADIPRLADRRGAVIASVGAESTKQAVEYARHAERERCDAVMAVPPMSAALSNDHLRGYFLEIASSVDLPIVLQDASGYVGRGVDLDLMLELLDELGPEKIYFKPEAPPVGSQLSALRDRSDGRARVFEGSGGIYLVDSYRRGVLGTMPGVDLLDGIVLLWRALEAGDDRAAYRLHLPICALVAIQMQAGLDGFLAIEKYLLVKRGLFTSAARRPPYAWSLDPKSAAEVDRLFERLQSAVRQVGAEQAGDSDSSNSAI